MLKVFFKVIMVSCVVLLTRVDLRSQVRSLVSFDWLVGTWQLTNEKTDQTTFEMWEKLTDTLFAGKNWTMNGRDTLSRESLRLFLDHGKIFYEAEVSHNPYPVRFELTEWTPGSFFSVNPDHDFPKSIAYQSNGTDLKATIAGNGKSIDFHFRRID